MNFAVRRTLSVTRTSTVLSVSLTTIPPMSFTDLSSDLFSYPVKTTVGFLQLPRVGESRLLESLLSLLMTRDTGVFFSLFLDFRSSFLVSAAGSDFGPTLGFLAGDSTTSSLTG